MKKSLWGAATAAASVAFAVLPAMATGTTAATTAPNWDSYQGNNQHTGYVPLTLRPRGAQQIWTWQSPHAQDGVMPFINPVTISDGRIAVTDDDYNSAQALYVLKERDGSLIWKVEFPADTPGLNPATIKDGKVFAATSGHQATFMHAFNAANGTLLWKAPFSAQWPHFLAPTVDSKLVVTAGGTYGGVFGFRPGNGRAAGNNTGIGFVDMFTPAMDDKFMYAYTTNVLNIIDRKTFAHTTIADPAPTSTCCYSYIGAPMLSTARNRVVALSGDNFSGRASSSTGGFYARALVSFDIAGGSLEWRSADTYMTQPALAHGKVFAGSNAPLRLAALNETDGKVAWSWVPADGSSQFCRNVIATDSHVLVSTERGVHAINLKTHQEDWAFPVSGELALSAKGTLVINEGCRESTGRMVAVSIPTR